MKESHTLISKDTVRSNSNETNTQWHKIMFLQMKTLIGTIPNDIFLFKVDNE